MPVKLTLGNLAQGQAAQVSPDLELVQSETSSPIINVRSTSPTLLSVIRKFT